MTKKIIIALKRKCLDCDGSVTRNIIMRSKFNGVGIRSIYERMYEEDEEVLRVFGPNIIRPKITHYVVAVDEDDDVVAYISGYAYDEGDIPGSLMRIRQEIADQMADDDR